MPAVSPAQRPPATPCDAIPAAWRQALCLPVRLLRRTAPRSHALPSPAPALTHLLPPASAPAPAAYFGSLLATLYVSFAMHSYLFSLLFCVAQVGWGLLPCGTGLLCGLGRG